MYLIPASWVPQHFQPYGCVNKRINAEDACIVKELNEQEISKYKSILETWRKNLSCAFEKKTGKPIREADCKEIRACTLWHDSYQVVDGILDDMFLDFQNLSNCIASINKFTLELEAICFFAINNEQQKNTLEISCLATNPKNFYTDEINANAPSIKGAATQLINKIIEISKQNRILEIKLTSTSSAVDFYIKNGFINSPGSSRDFTMRLYYH